MEIAVISMITIALLGVLVGRLMAVEPAFVTPSPRGTYSELVPNLRDPVSSEAFDRSQEPANREKSKPESPKSKKEEPDLNRPTPYRRSAYALPA